jgi:hypothetical protein
MAQHHFDDRGKLVKTVKTDQEVAEEAEGSAALFLAILVVWPILFGGWQLGEHLNKELNFHPLFAILSGCGFVGICLYAFVKQSLVRAVYLIVMVIGYSVAAFIWIRDASDIIWASAAACAVALGAGAFAKWLHENVEDF